MFRPSYAIAAIWFLAGVPAGAENSVSNLPPPVAAFAAQFDKECQDNGLGRLVVNDNYSDTTRGPDDLNADGERDYIVYKCMFGCSEKPFAFVGQLTPCPWGSLLLSQSGQYNQVFLPRMVSRIRAGSPVRILVQRPRALRLFGNCEYPGLNYDPQYIYELKGKRFQLLGMCSSDSSRPCLAGKSRESD